MQIQKRLIVFTVVLAALAGCDLIDRDQPPPQCETPVPLSPTVLDSLNEPAPELVLEELMVVDGEFDQQKLLIELSERFSQPEPRLERFVVYELVEMIDCTGGACTGVPPLPPKPFKLTAAISLKQRATP
jgi:hypothetical protein